LLSRIAEQLETIGEAGVRSARDIERLRTLSNDCGSLGLASVARAVARLADQLEHLRRSADGDVEAAAESLLRAHYVVKFTAAHEVVTSATASMCK
jgi:hypothetical protein